MSKPGVDRRTFIAVGSAAVAGLAATRLNAQSAPAQIVSVGYRPFLSRTRITGKVAASLVEASSVMSTEPSFIRTGARISIRGNARRSDVRVDVLHGADLVDGKVVFHAWASESNGLSFNVPVELQRTLDISVTVNKVPQLFAFTVADAEGALKLNPGMFVFALGTPSWRSLHFEESTLRNSDGSNVDFDYVTVSVSSPS